MSGSWCGAGLRSFGWEGEGFRRLRKARENWNKAAAHSGLEVVFRCIKMYYWVSAKFIDRREPRSCTITSQSHLLASSDFSFLC